MQRLSRLAPEQWLLTWPEGTRKYRSPLRTSCMFQRQTCYFLVSALLHKGGKIILEGNGFVIYVQDWRIVQGYLENNLFWFDISKPILHMHSSMSTPLEIWHQCMGHFLQCPYVLSWFHKRNVIWHFNWSWLITLLQLWAQEAVLTTLFCFRKVLGLEATDHA